MPRITSTMDLVISQLALLAVRVWMFRIIVIHPEGTGRYYALTHTSFRPCLSRSQEPTMGLLLYVV
jgi:hypothetical protein